MWALFLKVLSPLTKDAQREYGNLVRSRRSDVYATNISVGVAFSFLRLWQETAKRGIFDQKLNRKLVHISIGLAFMLCWPLFRKC
ncbi:hypothetical protein K1719_034255 [Acacia pycnantha]|nr:hypothetical protein K1719_034255 [Acacia pycnantha]